jgi:hypothetical protein
VPGFRGKQTRCVRYRLDDQGIARAHRLLGIDVEPEVGSP